MSEASSQAKNGASEGSLEKVLHNGPDKEEIAVHESSMTSTSYIKEAV